MTPVLVMRWCVSFAFLMFAILSAPALLSAPSTFSVWVGIILAVGSMVLAALVASTPVLDSFFKKIEQAFTKKETETNG